VIGFVSQFFSSPSGALGSTSRLGRQSSCADDGRVGARRSPPRAKAHGRIPPRGVLHDNSHSPGERPWLTGATGQERQPAPGAATLASHRNFINRASRRWAPKSDQSLWVRAMALRATSILRMVETRATWVAFPADQAAIGGKARAAAAGAERSHGEHAADRAAALGDRASAQPAIRASDAAAPPRLAAAPKWLRIAKRFQCGKAAARCFIL
jgi:hypothetical protein